MIQSSIIQAAMTSVYEPSDPRHWSTMVDMALVTPTLNGGRMKALSALVFQEGSAKYQSSNESLSPEERSLWRQQVDALNAEIDRIYAEGRLDPSRVPDDVLKAEQARERMLQELRNAPMEDLIAELGRRHLQSSGSLTLADGLMPVGSYAAERQEDGKIHVWDEDDRLLVLPASIPDHLVEEFAKTFEAGYERGKSRGYVSAQGDIRQALGL